MKFGGGHVGPDKGLEISSWHFALYRDHLDISYVRFGGGHVGPDEGFGDVWDIHASFVHDRGLEMSTWHLALFKDNHKSDRKEITTPYGGHSFESNVPVFSLLDVKFSLDVKQNLP